MTNPGPDGYGPPPTTEVVRAVAPFFSDKPVPLDPDKVRRISAQIRAREETIPWRHHRRT